MIDLSSVNHNPCLEELTDLICTKVQNNNRGFFRVEVAYFIGKIASCMRAYINTKDRGNIPVNIYALCLGNSGLGKGHSVNIMETEILSGFKKAFCGDLFDTMADMAMENRANAMAAYNGTQPEVEKDKLTAAYKRAGEYLFTFDSATAPAIKQLRSKLLLAEIGAINVQIDEIALNLLGSGEVLNTYLELYDQGLIKPKLIKNTNDQIRDSDIDGKTPANMLLFGTPVKLFDGGQVEDYFYTMLETGYARRLLFGFGTNEKDKAYYSQSAKEIYENLINPKVKQTVDKWNSHFTSLAQQAMYGWKIELQDSEAIRLLEYRIECEKQADELPPYAEIARAELSHRYFRALKLAGAFAFIDRSPVLKDKYLLQAIKLVEESGENFSKILTREKPYMKLAKYLAASKEDLTHADLTEALPFYKSSATQRNELMTLATAWGYKNHILIHKAYSDGIEFFRGEPLAKTDLNKLILSGSAEWDTNYEPVELPAEKFAEFLVKRDDIRWNSHHFKNNRRSSENALPEFNMIVLDVDGTASVESVRTILEPYCYIIAETKRSTKEANRFRLILPMQYILRMDAEEYKDFMENIMAWLPFECDPHSKVISQAWTTYAGKPYYTNLNGELLDPLKFIPHTSRNDQYKEYTKKIGNMSALERWFAESITEGNRNQSLLRFALCLVDSGADFNEVEEKLLRFNKQLKNGLPVQEIKNTILKTVDKKIRERGIN